MFVEAIEHVHKVVPTDTVWDFQRLFTKISCENLLVMPLARTDKYLSPLNIFLKYSKQKVGVNGQ